MDTLLIRLIAPMQSWGVQSNYTTRDSGLEPSKSGVIGLLCAALGRPRDAALDDLAALRMGVRVDREGTLRSDFHIAQDVLDSDGKGIRKSIVTNRYYLANAAFLVGLEGSRKLLLELQSALQKPVWTLFLGRKAFPPALPVRLGDGYQENTALEEALSRYGRIVKQPHNGSQKMRFVIEAPDGEQVRTDVPVSFAARRFSSRRVKIVIMDIPESFSVEVL